MRNEKDKNKEKEKEKEKKKGTENLFDSLCDVFVSY